MPNSSKFHIFSGFEDAPTTVVQNNSDTPNDHRLDTLRINKDKLYL